MIRIVTDTSADITNAQAEKLNVEIIEIPILFEDGACAQGTEADFDTFYKRLEKCDDLPSTSQPNPSDVTEKMEQAKADGDDLIFITISSGLSGTSSSAEAFKNMVDYDGIYVVDSMQTVMAQRILVEYAVQLREKGLSASEIVEKLNEIKSKLRIYAVIDTLKYLQKGGRVPKGLALIGTALNLKPVIACRNTVLETLGKARGTSGGKKMMYKDLQRVGIDTNYPVYFGYSLNKDMILPVVDELVEEYGIENYDIHPVGGVVGTHVGPNVIAVAFVIKNEDNESNV